MVGPQGSRTRKQRDPGIEELKADALRERCAVKAKSAVKSIISSKEPEERRAQVLLEIGVARGELPSIQILILSELRKLNPNSARTLINHLLKQPCDEDLEHVRGHAYAAIAYLAEFTPTDLTTLAAGLNSNSREVVSAIKNALGALLPARLKALKAALEQLQPATIPQVKRLSRALEEALREPDDHGVDQKKRSATVKRVETAPPTLQQAPPPNRRPPSTPMAKPSPAPRQVPTALTTVPPAAMEVTPAVTETPYMSGSAVGLSMPARPADPADHESLESIRDSTFQSMRGSDLLSAVKVIRDPHKLCACLAEIIMKFSKPDATEHVLDRLTWVISHPDPELKRKGRALLRRLTIAEDD